MSRSFVPPCVFIVPSLTSVKAILAVAECGGIPPSAIGVIQSVETQRQPFPRDRKLKEFPLWIRPKRQLSADYSAWLYQIKDGELQTAGVSPLDALNGCHSIVTDSARACAFNGSRSARTDIGYAPEAALFDFFSAWLDADEQNGPQKLRRLALANFTRLECPAQRPQPSITPTDLALAVELRRTMDRFAWNFRLNAMVIVRHIAGEVGGWGVETLEEILSNPLALQALFRIRAAGDEGVVPAELRVWRGTGKYPICHLPEWAEDSLGLLWKVTEEALSLEQLWEERRDRSKASGLRRAMRWPPLSSLNSPLHMRLSSLGRTICQLLHPNCEDSDLLSRLTVWARGGADVSEPQMARYIQTYYGRVWRYLDDIGVNGSLGAIINMLDAVERDIDEERLKQFRKARRRQNRQPLMGPKGRPRC